MASSLARSVATKLWAVWFVVLIALPFTAPFTTFDLIDGLRGRTQSGVTVVTPQPVLVAQTSTDDVLVSAERSHLKQPRLCALTTASCNHLASIPLLVSPFDSTPSIVLPVQSSPLQAILRL